MANLPWLPDPGDYAAPQNADVLPHPSQTALATDTTEQPATETLTEPTATAPAQTVESTTSPLTVKQATAQVEAATAELRAAEQSPTVGPFPPAPPTVSGDQVTESVNQAGPAA